MIITICCRSYNSGVTKLSYLILFFSALGAATLLPLYSEATLAYFLAGPHNVALLWGVATLGNTLGAVINWWLGRMINHFEDRPWFPVKRQSLHRAQGWFQRYGLWSLLLAWVPVVGDPLTFIGGIMKVRLLPFVLLVAIGKGARYAVVIFLFYSLSH